MRKFLALITVLVFGFIMVACTPSVKEEDVFISANKIVYNEVAENGYPKMDLADFSVFSVNSNRTVAPKAAALSDVTLTKHITKTNVYNVSIFGKTYEIYLYDASNTQTGPVVMAVSTTYGIEDEAIKIANTQKLLFTSVANKVDLSDIKVLTANYEMTSNANVEVKNAQDLVSFAATYEQDILKMSNNNLLTFKNGLVETTITNKTFKPADNQLPINTKMENSFIGYIWDWVLIIPIAFLMQLFAGLLGNSFAFGILFATLIVRTIAWPIYARTNDMSMKMAIAQPEMNKLQAKYATKKDPASQQKMQMEMMAIYKKHKISMFGCLMPILQMPLFLAMFQVVYRIQVPGGMFVDAVSNKKLFFGLIDLTVGGFNDVWSYVLAAIVGFTMWYLQKLSSKKPSYAKNTGTQVKTDQQAQQEQTMKTVSIVMVGMMVLTTLTSVNALGFYWVVGNIYSLVQAIINRKLSEKKYEKTKQAQSII